MSRKIIQLKTLNGESIAAGNLTVTPQMQVLSMQFPFGGFVWNRPTGVLVEQNGRSEHIPINDITRIITLLAAGLGAIAAVKYRGRRSKK